MPKSPQPATRKYVRQMINAACPAALDTGFAEALRSFSAKVIARKAHASPRTVEGWKQGKSVPQGRHVLAMLSDDELCARLLEAAGKSDLANAQETITALRKALGKVNE